MEKMFRVSLCVAILVLGSECGSGAPIPAPDINVCLPPSFILPQEHVVTCCPPRSQRSAVPYSLPPVTSLKIRRAAHRLDDAYVAKLVKAYDLMKALPKDDPRSFMHQARIHCAYCNQVYVQGNTTTPLQIHGSWLFFPLHRWYLYFHERILAHLLNDSSFALPYWAYDRSEGSSMPDAFLRHETLSDKYREKSHMPPAAAQIFHPPIGVNFTREEQVRDNEHQLYRVVVSGARAPGLFMGMPYRFGDVPFPGHGTVELKPHNTVHLWTGDSTTASYKDMGAFFSSGRDPLFYAHHALLDRLWTIWSSLDSHEGFNEPDFLDTEFTFYDENARLVTVKVRDSLVDEKMGYIYEPMDNSWLNATPRRLTKEPVTEVGPGYVQCKLGVGTVTEAKTCTTMVPRDPTVVYDKTEEVLVLQSPADTKYSFHLFLNYPDADAFMVRSNVTEFVGATISNKGTVSDVEASSSGVHTHRLGVGYHIKELGLSDYRNVAVTIVAVPLSGSDLSNVSFTIIDIRIEHQLIFPSMEISHEHGENKDLSFASK